MPHPMSDLGPHGDVRATPPYPFSAQKNPLDRT